ncbi:hypothetical protein Tco_0064876 [Tanacetum coccineum]
MGGSSSQPRTDPPRSPINAFLIKELYTPEFLESLQENTCYWQEPNDYEAVGEQVATSPTKKKKATRNRQKKPIQTDDAPRQIAWTTEEEIALAKGWRAVSENSQHGNMRKKDGFWCEVMAYIESKTKQEEITLPNFNQGYEGSSKRHKSYGSSSFNTESGDPSINLNTTVADEDEVQEIRRPGDRGRDKARAAAKNKGSKASGSSTMNDDALARLMVNEMTYVEVQQHEAFIELKKREVECREREIAAMEYRAQQEDIKLYLQPYDRLTGEQRLAMDEIRAKIKAKYNFQY